MTSLSLRRFAFALLAAVLTLALAAAPAPVQAQTLEPLDDTYIRENEGSTTNGDSTTLVVKYDPNSTRHAYYKFDLSGIADTTIGEAVLSVHHIAEAGETAKPTDAVVGLDDVGWKEGTASYDNSPGGSFGAEDTPALDDTTYDDSVGGRLNFDVTSYVNSLLDAGADSVTFKQVQEEVLEKDEEFIGFSSKENSDGNNPELRLTPAQVIIDISGDGGDPTGWRMLAAPVGGVTVGDLADETLVQGVPNMKYSDHDPNLHESYDGSGGYYPVPDGPDVTPAAGGAGQGFYWYFFERSEADVPENAGLPFSWTPVGKERTSDVTVSVEPTSQNFFMLGNPYRPAYDLSGLNLDKDGDGDGTQDFSNMVQVWDPNKGSDGGYVSLDHTNPDQVATGQGFFVERSDGGDGLATQLTFTAGDTTDGGTATFYGGDGRQTGSSTSSSQSAPIASASSGEGSGPRRVQLRVTSRDDGGTAQSSSSAMLYLTEGATRGADAYEATALGGMTRPYVTLAYERGETALKKQASLPRALSEEATLPLRVETAGNPGTQMTLTWPKIENVPPGWTLTLTDTQTGDTVELRGDADQYSFEHSSDGGNTQASQAQMGRPLVAASSTAAESPRFTMTAEPDAIPVEATGFSARVDGQAAVLTWRTLSETNNDRFVIERQTEGGAGWAEAATVESQAEEGTSSEPLRYQARVEDLDYGSHTFHLRQVDRGGGGAVVATRQRVEVTLNEAYALSAAYPNPFSERATVEFAARADGEDVTVALYNTLGQRVRVLHDGPIPGSETQTLTLEAGSLSSGTYFVRLVGEEGTRTQTVTLVR
jgi:hypothetical protein